MTIIETQNLDFSFKKGVNVLSGLDLRVEKGSIYGFLGPNGSGKTTTIRLLLGLLTGRGQDIRLFGRNLMENRIGILARIGSLIEQPSLYEHLSGFDNLEITRRQRNLGSDRIRKVLELVDLADEADKKVRAYSLGMKQRLGLATALLSTPELLILDEPVNGLDPNGIMEIRELLLKLNRELGVTIFVSSHQLPEIEKIVTHLGILRKGRLVFQGEYQDLKERLGGSSVLELETSDNPGAALLLKDSFAVQPSPDSSVRVTCGDKYQAAAVCRLLVSAGIDIFQMQMLKKDLEDIFLEITSN